ncbi:uncharacterized protein APUU_61086S [Aspergillus puulaauensis]|uniref:Uncharacterized protein n=1 Tax=Aspergillus puulaauensis TaxID=1220207 RepID=A0A7R7XW43_9EURO|nr:uncharacterized protein APUU_61086S [Aspergillus puulaauensis]BCS28038.1 hypothetical protein APUU_61086S [Aspergillus puulaauensis]
MRFITLALAALFAGLVSAEDCVKGHTECGAGPAAANTIMVCGEDGIPTPVTTCTNGQTCQNVGPNNGPTCA